MNEQASVAAGTDVSGMEGRLAELLARLESQPQDPALHRRVARLLNLLGRSDEAVAHLELSLQEDPDHPWALHARGLAALEREDRATAEELLHRLADHAQQDFARVAYRGSLLNRLGRPAAAVPLLESALEQEPTADFHAWIEKQLTHGYFDLGDVGASCSHARCWVAADQESAEARYWLGSVLCRIGKAAEARTHLVRSLELEPASCHVWLMFGLAAADDADLSAALPALDKARDLDPEDPQPWLAIARFATGPEGRRNALDEAERRVLEVRDPRYRGECHRLLARYYHERHDEQTAFDHSQAAVAADPLSADAQHSLGAGYWERGNQGAAVEHLSRAVELSPQNGNAWYVLGMMSSRAGQLEPAEGALRRALDLGHDEGPCRAELAWVLEKLGRPLEAAAQAKRALKFPLGKKRRSWMGRLIEECRHHPCRSR